MLCASSCNLSGSKLRRGLVGDDLTVGANVGDARDVGPARLALRFGQSFERAEAPAELDLLVVREVLIGEDQHAVVEPRLFDRPELLVVDRPQRDAGDGGPQRGVGRGDRDRHAPRVAGRSSATITPLTGGFA